jgi:hypothetical protein
MIAKNSEAANFVSWAFESKGQKLALLKNSKVCFAWPPKIYFRQIPFRRKKIKPSIISIGDKQIDHESAPAPTLVAKASSLPESLS